MTLRFKQTNRKNNTNAMNWRKHKYVRYLLSTRIKSYQYFSILMSLYTYIAFMEKNNVDYIMMFHLKQNTQINNR